MLELSFIFTILALLCFLAGAIDLRTPPVRPNWISAGLALLTLAWLVMRGK